MEAEDVTRNIRDFCYRFVSTRGQNTGLFSNENKFLTNIWLFTTKWLLICPLCIWYKMEITVTVFSSVFNSAVWPPLRSRVYSRSSDVRTSMQHAGFKMRADLHEGRWSRDIVALFLYRNWSVGVDLCITATVALGWLCSVQVYCAHPLSCRVQERPLVWIQDLGFAVTVLDFCFLISTLTKALHALSCKINNSSIFGIFGVSYALKDASYV